MRLVVFAVIALVLAAPAAAVSITAKLTTTTRAPIAGEPWRFTVTVRRDGQPVAARLRVHVLRGNTVIRCWNAARLVRCRERSPGEWIGFRGTRTGVLRWPAALVGGELTFRAVVTTGHTRIRLEAPVRVRPAG